MSDYGFELEQHPKKDYTTNKDRVVAVFENIEQVKQRDDFRKILNNKTERRFFLEENPSDTDNNTFKLGMTTIQNKYILRIIEEVWDEKITYKNDKTRVMKTKRGLSVKLTIYHRGKMDHPVGFTHEDIDRVFLVAPLIEGVD